MTSLQALLDERDITQGLGRFARLIDGKRWDALGEVFAADLTFNYGAGEQAGLEALRTTMRRFLDVCGATQHLIGSIIVEIAGDQAVSRAYVQARHQGKGDPAGAVFDSSGEYVDRWARRPEGWRIIRREAAWQMHTGDPAILQADRAELG
jgi:3-phenylpropionate/cinnamic acid dioxygenase small subunit